MTLPPTNNQLPETSPGLPSPVVVIASQPPLKAWYRSVRLWISLMVVLLVGAGSLWLDLKPTPKQANQQRSVSSTVASGINSQLEQKTSQTVASAPIATSSPTTPRPASSSTTSIANKVPAITTAPASPVSPANTTNCLPANPTTYQQYFTKITNSQYLQANSYVNTDKLYADLQFAGLASVIDSKQYVVLAMDDYAFGSLTASQLAWMSQSPANMRSVMGWQVITSCITWNGLNPVKGMAAGTTETVNTLNGPVTFTAGTLGTFGNTKVSIWDWFTSNGSVTIVGGFVSPPSP